MSKVIISGIRTCDQKDPVVAEINSFIAEIGNVTEIVTGGSTGVEKIAKEHAGVIGLKNKEILPDWEADLNAAGMIRDEKLAAYGSHLLVLTDGVTKGCNHLIQEAQRENLTIKVVPLFPAPASGDEGIVKKRTWNRLFSST